MTDDWSAEKVAEEQGKGVDIVLIAVDHLRAQSARPASDAEGVPYGGHRPPLVEPRHRLNEMLHMLGGQPLGEVARFLNHDGGAEPIGPAQPDPTLEDASGAA